MSRYIDADKLCEELTRFVKKANNHDYEPTPKWNDAVSIIHSMPTVDVVEVVHGEMNDLISREDAIDIVEKWFQKIGLNGDICLDGLRSLPSAQPTADVEEVVRCGACKWLEPNGKCRVFADSHIRPSATDYCSYGERREDGTT